MSRVITPRLKWFRDDVVRLTIGPTRTRWQAFVRWLSLATVDRYAWYEVDTVVVGLDPVCALMAAHSLQASGRSVLVVRPNVDGVDSPYKEDLVRRLVAAQEAELRLLRRTYPHLHSSTLPDFLRSLCEEVSVCGERTGTQVAYLERRALKPQLSRSRFPGVLMVPAAQGPVPHPDLAPDSERLWSCIREGLACVRFAAGGLTITTAKSVVLTTQAPNFVPQALPGVCRPIAAAMVLPTEFGRPAMQRECDLKGAQQVARLLDGDSYRQHRTEVEAAYADISLSAQRDAGL